MLEKFTSLLQEKSFQSVKNHLVNRINDIDSIQTLSHLNNTPHFELKAFIELIFQINSDEQILKIRQELWADNFGVPTLYFALTCKAIIDKYLEFQNINLKAFLHDCEELNKSCQKEDINFYDRYDMPPVDEKGFFIPTLNKQGFMTTTAIDPFTLKFIKNAASACKTGGKVLEIGAAYGVATLEALKHEATVYCNDIEPLHLAVVVKEHKKLNKGKLVPVLGAFPYEMQFNENEFDAILISRVLHFFDGEQIVSALKKARSWLKSQGKLYVINETPYLSNWKSFLDEYNNRKTMGDTWPGLIDNTKQFETNRSLTLPPLVHWLDKETLMYALKEAGFKENAVEIEYINRKNQFPSDLLMNEEQRESVGCSVAR